MKKLLMLGTSYESCEMIKYAKSKGVYTIVTDPREPEKSIAKLVADEYWMINVSDIDLLEKKCKEEKINAVICGVRRKLYQFYRRFQLNGFRLQSSAARQLLRGQSVHNTFRG